jgi:UDP-N-acetylglucosamine--N-acetylmuramyl-(pentapeptide) pyrophosphoryl-undecaprenol N-acetylglucosamine transferase
VTTHATERPIALAASGGGHLELLASVDDALNGHSTVWVASPGARASALAECGRTVRELPNPGRQFLKYGANLRAAVGAVLRDRPRVVVTSGAGSVVPYSLLARLTGAKVIFIETMARVTNPSASGRVLSRVASTVLVQWPEMERVYRGAIVCRPALCEAVAPSHSEGEGTFVAVGTHSEPFDRLLKLVDGAVGKGLLPQPVIAQGGVSTYKPRNFEVVAWLPPDEIEPAIERSRYVVCHAGSGVISSALRAGRRPLVLPRREGYGEHFDDHQIQLARRLDDLGLVVRIQGFDLLPEQVQAADGGPPQAALKIGFPSVDEALTTALAAAGRT